MVDYLDWRHCWSTWSCCLLCWHKRDYAWILSGWEECDGSQGIWGKFFINLIMVDVSINWNTLLCWKINFKIDLNCGWMTCVCGCNLYSISTSRIFLNWGHKLLIVNMRGGGRIQIGGIRNFKRWIWVVKPLNKIIKTVYFQWSENIDKFIFYFTTNSTPPLSRKKAPGLRI